MQCWIVGPFSKSQWSNSKLTVGPMVAVIKSGVGMLLKVLTKVIGGTQSQPVQREKRFALPQALPGTSLFGQGQAGRQAKTRKGGLVIANERWTHHHSTSSKGSRRGLFLPCIFIPFPLSIPPSTCCAFFLSFTPFSSPTPVSPHFSSHPLFSPLHHLGMLQASNRNTRKHFYLEARPVFSGTYSQESMHRSTAMDVT